MKKNKQLIGCAAMCAATLAVSIVLGTTLSKRQAVADVVNQEIAKQEAAASITKISDIEIPAVPSIQPTKENGVITIEEWKQFYPDIAASLEANGSNTERVKYTETNPYIQVLYDGMAFSYDYTSAVGHTYTLEDIGETTRPHKLANCLTCKTADFTALVNNIGVEAYSMDFGEVYSQMSETVTCYQCHANTPGTLVLTHDYTVNAIQDEIDAGVIDPANAVCAQCHTEYYFDPATKATTHPWFDKESIHPDAILALENEIGYVDYTNANTGTKMIKVQHPEFETYTGKGSVHAGTFNCADCHMGVAFGADGTPYVSHELTSPLNNQKLIDDTCAVCHSDLVGFVKGIQDETRAREDAIAEQLVELNSKLAAAVEAGVLTEEQLDAIRAVNRDAQFYWDFVYVENSEGAHNRKLTNECLDKAEQLCQQALAML